MVPSPAELTYFMEVAQFLNLTRAAERLGITQPSLSLSIKKLEKSLGVQLFIRHKQGVTLTPAGKLLLDQVNPLLTHWENTKNLAKVVNAEVCGRISIGCRSALAHYLRNFFRYLLEKYPKLEISFNFQAGLSTTENVINSLIDIGIVGNPVEHYDLIFHEIGTSDLMLWSGQGNSPMQDIHSGQAVLIYEPGVPQAQILLRQLKLANIQIARTVIANSLEVVASLTVAGCGIGLMPSCFAMENYGDKLKLVEEMPSYTNDVYLIYRYENKEVQLITTIVNELRQFSGV